MSTQQTNSDNSADVCRKVIEGQQYVLGCASSEKENFTFNNNVHIGENACNNNTSSNNNNNNNKDVTAPTSIISNASKLSNHINDDYQAGSSQLLTQHQQNMEEAEEIDGLVTSTFSKKIVTEYIEEANLSPPVNFDDSVLQPLTERWSPLGANYDDAISPVSEMRSPEYELELLGNDNLLLDKKQLATENTNELARLRNIEEEQELLTSSLMALTSHFAHVQLRVRQIVEAPVEERDQLLKDLEQFAFQGIPEPATLNDFISDDANSSRNSKSGYSGYDSSLAMQCSLIEQLKDQLTELEKLAYESGAPVLPQHMLLEKQKIIIDELKKKLNLKVDEKHLPELSAEELKSQVDTAIGEFVGPLKMKEQLVAQLKTQITDLERFIAFLQCDDDADDMRLKVLTSGNSEKFSEVYNSYAAKKKKQSQIHDKHTESVASAANKCKGTTKTDGIITMISNNNSNNGAKTVNGPTPNGMRESLNSKAHGLLDKASLLMQMFASTHFTHSSKCEQFQRNSLKRTSKGNHWGDLRAQLEVDIQEVASLAATLSCDREKLANIKRTFKQKKCTSATSTAMSSSALTTVPPRRFDATREHFTQGLTSYIIGSNSSDSEEDAFDRYNWEKTSCSQRLVHARGDTIATISKELTTVVRKNFAKTLQQLIQHGLRVETESTKSSLIVPFMRCLNPTISTSYSNANSAGTAAGTADARNSFLATHMADIYAGDAANYDDVGYSSIFGYGRPMHVWELIMEYYYLKHGDEYNNKPARKLSQSFNLHIVDSQVFTAKQSLLSAVGMIVAMHRPYKRSLNAHFKAFVCAGLNSHQLVEWLNLILSCNELTDVYYAPNSYVARTGFRDSLRSIDALSKYEFDLPVDLAIRHFRNI